LRDAQERIDEAEARSEQLTVQLLLLQHKDSRPGTQSQHSNHLWTDRTLSTSKDNNMKVASNNEYQSIEANSAYLHSAQYRGNADMVKEVEEKDYNSDSQYSESQLDSDSTSRIEGSQERARIHRDRASKREGVEGDAHEYNRQSHVSNKGATFPSDVRNFRNSDYYSASDPLQVGADEDEDDERDNSSRHSSDDEMSYREEEGGRSSIPANDSKRWRIVRNEDEGINTSTRI